MKTLVAVNTLTSIARDSYHTHMNLWYRLGKDHPKEEDQFFQFSARRMSIDRFRNEAARIALQLECDYLLFLDDDMLVPKDTFNKLKEAELDIIAALNYIRGYPFETMSFRYKEGTKHLENITHEEVKDQQRVIPCDAIGTATCLIKVEVFKQVPGPWFITGPHNTEDIYFCIKAKEYLPKLTIGTHCGVRTGHMLDPEVICVDTQPALKAYYESFMNPGELERIKKPKALAEDRDLNEYVNINVGHLLVKEDDDA